MSTGLHDMCWDCRHSHWDFHADDFKQSAHCCETRRYHSLIGARRVRLIIHCLVGIKLGLCTKLLYDLHQILMV